MAKKTSKPTKQNIEPPENHEELPDWNKAADAFSEMVRAERDEIIRLCDAKTYVRFE